MHEQFDLVLVLGVLYHLRYPLLGLEIVADKARKLLALQTLTAPGNEVVQPPADLSFDERSVLAEPGWPRLAFIEHSFAGDPTNWWVPNRACVEAMLRAVGLDVVGRPGDELYVCEVPPGRRRSDQFAALLGAFSGSSGTDRRR